MKRKKHGVIFGLLVCILLTTLQPYVAAAGQMQGKFEIEQEALREHENGSKEQTSSAVLTSTDGQEKESHVILVEDFQSFSEAVLSSRCRGTIEEMAEKRLIVQSSHGFDPGEATEIIQGYENLFVLTYESAEACSAAYENLQNIPELSVERDSILMTSTMQESSQNAEEESNGYAYRTLPVSSREIKIAVIDSGFDFNHHGNPRVETGLDLTGTNTTQDEHGHGTAMTGILLEHTSDCVKIIPVKAADGNGRTSALKIYLGMQYAVEQNADIINLSMTAYKAKQSRLLAKYITEVSEQGIIVVTAAGNENQDTAEYTPANVEAAVVAAAIQPDGSKMELSNFGSTVDFCSYGSVESYGLGGEKVTASGTSVSAALISVAAAQLMVMDNETDRNGILEKLKQGAYDLGEQGRDPYFGYGAVTPEQINGLYEGTVCESAAIFTADIHHMEDAQIDQLLEHTTQVNLSRYLKDLSYEERAYLLDRNTMLRRGYEVWENITNQQETCTYKTYESYYTYLMENEFETAWYAASSTKSGYWYFSLNGDVDRYNVKLTGLPTSGNENNAKASITRSWDADYVDSKNKKGHTNGLGFSSGHAPTVSTGLGDDSYIYIGMRLEIPTQKGTHCKVICAGVSGLKTSDGKDVQGGAGITVWEDEKKSIIKKCTKEETKASGIGCQIGFGAAGIATAGTNGGTGHCKISIETQVNDEDGWGYQKNNNIENGKRSKKCSVCKSVMAVEYLQVTEVRFMDTEGKYEELEEYHRVKEEYAAEGDTVPAYTYNEMAQGDYRKAVRKSYQAPAKAQRKVLKVPRKTYSIAFFGNGSTAGGTAAMSPVYFGQTKLLTANGFSRGNTITLNPRGGKFEDGALTAKNQNITHTFYNWNRDAWGNSTAYINQQSINNLTGTDGDTINLYAIWSQGNMRLPDVKKKGYRFKGWSADENAKEGMKGDYATWKDETLFAIWEPDVFAVKLDAQGAQNQGTDVIWEKYDTGYYSDNGCFIIFRDNKITPPRKIDEKDEIEWVFAGYFTEKNGAGKRVVMQDGTLVSNVGDAGDYRYFTGNATVYAYYLKCYPIVYHSNLGEKDRINDAEVILPLRKIAGDGERITITCENPTVKNETWKYIYRFRGWSTTADGTNILVDPYQNKTKDYTVTKRLDLYAVWDTDFKVSYIGNEQTEGKDYVDGVHKSLEEYTYQSNEPGDIDIEAGEDYFVKEEELPAMDIKTGEYVDADGNPYKEKVKYSFQGWSAKKTKGEYENSVIFKGQDKKAGYDLLEEFIGYGEYAQADRNRDTGITIGKPSAFFGENDSGHKLKTDENTDAAMAFYRKEGQRRILQASEHEEDMPYVNLFAVWDEFPRIYVSDNYFALEYAVKLTQENILNLATATDRENPEDVALDLKDFDFAALVDTAEKGEAFEYPIIYTATDKKGNRTEKTVIFYFSDSGAYDRDEGTLRFISAEHISTLDENSIWKREAYEKELTSCLLNQRKNQQYTQPSGMAQAFGEKPICIAGTGNWQKEPEQVWSFSKEQIIEIKELVKNKGVGTAETIQNFMAGYQNLCKKK